MATKHALLSASTAARWIACPPSARLCENATDKPSEFAAQGTGAHSLCEYKLRRLLGEKVRKPKLSFYDNEMEDCCESYALFVMGYVSQFANPLVMVEQRVDFSDFVPEGYGTADALIIADKEMYIFDFKYGRGVEVSAERNPQMMCYALGCLQMFGNLYDIESVNMIIFQPRLANVSDFTIGKQDMLDWAQNTLIPSAKLAFDGKGEYCAGAHCLFCKVKTTCRKRAEYNLTLAQYDFAMPPTLEDTEIESILPKIDDLTAWASDIKDYALQQALSGKVWRGFKLVEGRSNRKYTDETAVAEVVTAAGYNPYEEKLLGITAMNKLLGGKKFAELLGNLIEKPLGKPVLVVESDKRPAMNSAKDDFADPSVKSSDSAE